MEQRRCFRQGQEQEDDVDLGISGRETKRRRFAKVVRDVMAMSELSLNEMMMSRMEAFFRMLVREQVELATQRFLHSSPSNQIESSGVRKWQLHFVNKLPPRIFTGSRVEAEDRTSIRIVMLDAHSRDVIASGHLSSLKVEILVLNGDFGIDEDEDWTEDQFNANIVREREGKRPLLTGDLFVTLRGGVGVVENINFTDNSSWIRSRKFRLGARIVSGVSHEAIVREARSEAFVVKDHRGELYKKHHPPSLDDEVWRLERIAKDGASHRRLAENEIENVRGFLRLYVIDQSLLRDILGTAVSNKIWEIIIEHATACVLNYEELYVYYRVEERVGLLLNSIYKVVGATFDGQNYQALDTLTVQQKVLVEDLKQRAYKNVNEIVPFATRPLPTIQAGTLTNPGLPELNFPVTQQYQSEPERGFGHSPSSAYDLKDNSQFEFVPVAQYHPMETSSPMPGSSFIMRDPYSVPFNGGLSWSPSGLPGPVTPNIHLSEDPFQFQTSTLFPVSSPWDQGNAFFFSANNADLGILSSHPNCGITVSRKGKHRARWCKIRAAVKWGILVKRDLAAKRMEQRFCCLPQRWD